MRRRYNQSLRGGGKTFKEIVTDAYQAAPHIVDGGMFHGKNANLTGFRKAFGGTKLNPTDLSPYFQTFATHLSKYVHNPVYATLWIHYGKGKNLEPLRHWKKKDATETSVGTFAPINNIEKLKKAVTATLTLRTPTTPEGIEKSEIDARKIFQEGFFVKAGRTAKAVVKNPIIRSVGAIGALATVAALSQTDALGLSKGKVNIANSKVPTVPISAFANATAEAKTEVLGTATKQCDKNEHAERDAAIVNDAEQDVQTAREKVITLTNRPPRTGEFAVSQKRLMELEEAIKHKENKEKIHADLQKKYIDNHGFLKYEEHKIDTTYKSTDTGSWGCLIS